MAATFAYADGSVAQLTSVWHQVLSRESSRRLEMFCEDALLWTDDDYLGPLHVQTSAGTEVVELPLPEWAGRLQVPEVYAKGLAAYATPTKAFLDALAASGPRRRRAPGCGDGARRAPARGPGLRLGRGRWGSEIGGERR